MGIDGLLKLLDPIATKQHISSFRNQTAAVDAMSWLYKGCYRCAFELNQNIETTEFLYYIFEMLEILSYYNIRPILVFDGRVIGKKDDTLDKRRRNKEENKQKGLKMLDEGNEEEARKYLSRCIVIDQRIITVTMSALLTKGVDYMVAPYESDSQIAKLVQLGIADFAITEDSDLLLYGVRAVLKLTPDGDCDYIDLDKWKPSDVDTAYLKAFLMLSRSKRVEAGVMAGSDYNCSIKGIGLKRAVKHLTERQNVHDIIELLRTKETYSQRIPNNYQQVVLESKLIFMFATVYNPLSNSLQFLNPDLLDEQKPIEMSEDDLRRIVGQWYDYSPSVREGKVNPRNMQPRQIRKVDIKEIFSANRNSLDVRQSANRGRQEYYRVQRKKREEERAQNDSNESIQPTNLWRKPPAPKKREEAPVVQVEITEQQRQQNLRLRKAQRVERFNQFKSVLQSLVLEDSSDSDSSQQSSKRSAFGDKKKVNRTSTKEDHRQDKEQKEEQESDNQESCSQSLQLGLEALNPWLKK